MTTDSNFIHFKWKGEHAMNFKKVASIALAGAMAMSMMAVPAFADGTGTTTTTTTTSTGTKVDVTAHTYEAYQIFTGTQASAGQPLGNVKWGLGVDSTGLLNALESNPISGLDFSACASKENTAQAVADVLATGNKGGQASDAQAREFAKIAYAHKTTTSIALGKESTNDITRTTNGNTVTYRGKGITTGYYLIEDTTTLTENTDTDVSKYTNDAYNLTVLQVADTITISSKNEYPTIEKKILDPDEMDQNEASMGEDVKYELKSTVPNMEAYTTGYYFYMSDMQSKGLTLNEDSFTVTVGGTTLKEGQDYTVMVEKYQGEDKIKYIDTTDEYPTAFEINFSKIKDYTAGAAIKVTYTAELNKDAAIYPAANPNKVNLHYSNNPNEDYGGGHQPGEKPTKPTGETPWDEVKTYTTGVKLQKTGADRKTFTDALKDAEFTLTTTDGMKYAVVTTNAFTEDANGTYYKLTDGTYTTTAPTDATASNYASTTTKYKNATTTNVTNDGKTTTTVTAKVDPVSGQIVFKGLGAGKYTLTETKTPAGYNTAAPVEFTISFTNDAANPTFTSDNSAVTFNGTTGLFGTTIVNNLGNTLPSTGGVGTRMFYVFGGCLVAAAAVLLALKKRREA